MIPASLKDGRLGEASVSLTFASFSTPSFHLVHSSRTMPRKGAISGNSLRSARRRRRKIQLTRCRQLGQLSLYATSGGSTTRRKRQRSGACWAAEFACTLLACRSSSFRYSRITSLWTSSVFRQDPPRYATTGGQSHPKLSRRRCGCPGAHSKRAISLDIPALRTSHLALEA